MIKKKIIQLNNFDNFCYICLEKVNRYYIFDCDCHIYAHSKCINLSIMNKCILCKNKLNHISNNNLISNSENILNFDFAIGIIELIKLKEFSDYIFWIIQNNNYLLFSIYIMYSFVIMYMIIIPLFTFNIFINLSHFIINKINFDYVFLFLLLTVSLSFFMYEIYYIL